MHDLLIRRADVGNLLDGVTGPVDIAVEDGKIAAIAPEIRPDLARAVVEAEGRLVLPGLVDTHIHVSGEFGSAVGYQMMLRAGVTTALDMAGDPAEIRTTAGRGRGMTIGVLFPVIPGKTVDNRDPSLADLRRLLEDQLRLGALGLKVLGGHYPLTPDATARVFEVCAEHGAYSAIHAGTTETGSDIRGLVEAAALADGRRVHYAHINSYCRGQIDDPITEAAQAVSVLQGTPSQVSESYLSRINAADATCVDGVPVSRVVITCLRLGGYGGTEPELVRAIKDGWAMVHGEVDGEVRLLEPGAGLDTYERRRSEVAVSFAVNPASSSLALGLARKRDSGAFVIDAFSTDGGSLPRNTTLAQGLALVAARALTLQEFSWKASGAPAAMLGLEDKGRLAVGADADLIVVGPDSECDLSIIGGQAAWRADRPVDGGRPAIVCHPLGAEQVAESATAIPRTFDA
jgi:cytosine/adenosine deaminase-related metal-dependent hydrolase